MLLQWISAILMATAFGFLLIGRMRAQARREKNDQRLRELL